MHENIENRKQIIGAPVLVLCKWMKVEGIDIFFRSAGDPSNPAIVLLHGFPSSSHMYRKIISLLADKYYVIAPDYPGFGSSSMPAAGEFPYTFDEIAVTMEKFLNQLAVEKFVLYCQGYGGPVGFRIAVRNPDRIAGLVIQNTVVSRNGLGRGFERMRALWRNPSKRNQEAVLAAMDLDTTRRQYLHGAENPEVIGPDGYSLDQYFLNREGNADIQLALQQDYRHNIERYPQWQEYLRRYQPPTLVVWGKNDYFFTIEGARTFKYLVKDAKLFFLEGGHFVLEEKYYDIAFLIHQFFKE